MILIALTTITCINHRRVIFLLKFAVNHFRWLTSKVAQATVIDEGIFIASINGTHNFSIRDLVAGLRQAAEEVSLEFDRAVFVESLQDEGYTE
jgi:hypothetical protein